MSDDTLVHATFRAIAILSGSTQQQQQFIPADHNACAWTRLETTGQRLVDIDVKSGEILNRTVVVTCPLCCVFIDMALEAAEAVKP